MTAKFKLVKLTNAKKWPVHGALPPPENHSWAKWRGKEIAIGEGVMPAYGCWECDTKQVYPVTDETLARIGFKPEACRTIFVCEHQIQAVPSA